MTDTPHFEQQYLDLMRHVWSAGCEKVDRTGVGTRSLFGATLRFSLADNAVPLLTTKRIYWKTAAREVLWFLSGVTNIRPLVEQGVHIWTDWPLDAYRKASGKDIDRDAFERRIVEDEEFSLEWGDLGPVYGAQWVNWPRYEPLGDGIYRRHKKGHNQIADLVEGIRNNPGSRRLLFTGWNVDELDEMAVVRVGVRGRFAGPRRLVVGERDTEQSTFTSVKHMHVAGHTSRHHPRRDRLRIEKRAIDVWARCIHVTTDMGRAGSHKLNPP